MTLRRIIGFALILLAMAAVLTIAQWLTGWRPRSGLEAEFQRIIATAQIEDRYRGPDNGGWDSADVSGEVCSRVDLETMQSMGMSKKPFWPMPVDGRPSRPIYSWRMTHDSGLLAACSTFSIRYLTIVFDAESLTCSAKVSTMPTCDL